MKNALLKSYISQVKSFPLLSAEEEIALAEKIQSGSKSAYNKLVNSNLRLVLRIAYKMNVSSSILMDLVQEGNLGLMTAAHKYDGAFKTRFSTYAYPWITQYMIRYIDSHLSTIAMPHRKEEFLHKINNAKEHLFQEYGRNATEKEIADFLNTTEKTIHTAIMNSCPVSSLDVEVQNDGVHSVTVGDLVTDTRYNPEERFVDSEEKRNLHKLIKNLPGNEKSIILHRYCFEDANHAKTLRELSALIGISPEAVRQTEMRALKRLRCSELLSSERKLG